MDICNRRICWKLLECFLQKENQTEFRIEKVINKKDDKLNVKGSGHDNLFNNWVDKKDIA